MKHFAYILGGVVHEIIPEFSDVFPGIPLEQRYSADFLAGCVECDDAVKQSWLYADGTFVSPPSPEEMPESSNEHEENEMAVTYATLLVNGKRTFADVPALLKAKVRQVLIDLNCAKLAAE